MEPSTRNLLSPIFQTATAAALGKYECELHYASSGLIVRYYVQQSAYTVSGRSVQVVNKYAFLETIMHHSMNCGLLAGAFDAAD